MTTLENSMAPRTWLSAVLALVLIASPGSAASDAEDESRPNSLTAGAWAIQFYFEDFGSLASFQGASFAVKKHLTAQSALAIGFTFAGQYEDSEESFDESLSGSGHDDSYDIRVETLYIRYPSLRSSLHLFLGAGPFASTLHSERVRDREYPEGQVVEHREFLTHELGLTAMAGVEYFVTRRIGLLAQYGGYVSHRWFEEEVLLRVDVTDVENIERESKEFRFGARTGRLGIAAYFP